LRTILILSSHLHLGLPSGLFPSGFLIKILDAFHISSGTIYMHSCGHQSITPQRKKYMELHVSDNINHLLFVFISAIRHVRTHTHTHTVSILSHSRNVQILPNLHTLEHLHVKATQNFPEKTFGE
jgi:hypothetical protein